MPVAQVDSPEPGLIQQDTLAALFAALEGPLLAYAYKLAQQSETAQDIVQEAFVRLHSQKKQIEHPKAWLYRTVHNLAINHHRSNRKIVPLVTGEEEGEPKDLPDHFVLPDEAVQRLEAINQTKVSLLTLDERSRMLVRLRFEEGLSYKEMSEQSGLSISNVGYLLHHALKHLGEELERAGVAP